MTPAILDLQSAAQKNISRLSLQEMSSRSRTSVDQQDLYSQVGIAYSHKKYLVGIV